MGRFRVALLAARSVLTGGTVVVNADVYGGKIVARPGHATIVGNVFARFDDGPAAAVSVSVPPPPPPVRRSWWQSATRLVVWPGPGGS